MLNDKTPHNEIPLVCDLTAIDAAEREQHQVTGQELFATVFEIKELADGYNFRLPVASLTQAVQFITNERLCCPFFNFTLKLEAQSAALWLSLTGTPEVKQLIRADIGTLLDEKVAQVAGLR